MMDGNFRTLVAEMRAAQKEYFRTRSKDALQKSKELEKLVDIELKNNSEQTLF